MVTCVGWFLGLGVGCGGGLGWLWLVLNGSIWLVVRSRPMVWLVTVSGCNSTVGLVLVGCTFRSELKFGQNSLQLG